MTPLQVACPCCVNTFELNIEEAMQEDDLIEECPICGCPIDILIQRDGEGNIKGVEVRRDEDAL